jgi:hypothetical protein
MQVAGSKLKVFGQTKGIALKSKFFSNGALFFIRYHEYFIWPKVHLIEHKVMAKLNLKAINLFG